MCSRFSSTGSNTKLLKVFRSTSSIYLLLLRVFFAVSASTTLSLSVFSLYPVLFLAYLLFFQPLLLQATRPCTTECGSLGLCNGFHRAIANSRLMAVSLLFLRRIQFSSHYALMANLLQLCIRMHINALSTGVLSRCIPSLSPSLPACPLPILFPISLFSLLSFPFFSQQYPSSAYGVEYAINSIRSFVSIYASFSFPFRDCQCRT